MLKKKSVCRLIVHEVALKEQRETHTHTTFTSAQLSCSKERKSQFSFEHVEAEKGGEREPREK